MNFYPVDYIDDKLMILDQTKLPGQESIHRATQLKRMSGMPYTNSK